MGEVESEVVDILLFGFEAIEERLDFADIPAPGQNMRVSQQAMQDGDGSKS